MPKLPLAPTIPARRKPGPKPKSPKSAAAAALAEVESASSAARRYISGKVRKFVMFFAESGFIDPEQAALAAGYRQGSTGYKLMERYRDLVDNERLRRSMGRAMGLEEGLELLAAMARSADDERVRLQAVTTVVRVHGALSDRPLAPESRRQASRELDEMLSRIRQKLGEKGVSVKVRAIERVLEADIRGENEGKESESEEENGGENEGENGGERKDGERLFEK